MQILIVNHYAGAPHLGMEYRPYYMAREWVKLGHKVWIVAADHSHLRQITTSPGIQKIDGINYRWISTPAYNGNGLRRVLNMRSFCSGLSRLSAWIKADVRPDVVIASSTYPMDIWPCCEIARQNGARLVWEVHDLWPLSPMELGGMPWWHPFILWVQRAEDAACRCADIVVSMLPNADRHLTTRGLDPHKFHFVPNGISLSDWGHSTQPMPEAHRSLFDKLAKQGRWVLGYTGAHGVANALHTVVDAFSSLMDTNASLVLVGQGPRKNQLVKRALRQGGDIHFLPPVPKQAIPDILRACDALYVGSQSKQIYQFGVSPNKIMDYAMAAKPIINAIAAPNDIVADANCGISVPPENSTLVANAVRHLMSLPSAKLVSMGKRGEKYVVDNFAYNILGQKFLSAIIN